MKVRREKVHYSNDGLDRIDRMKRCHDKCTELSSRYSRAHCLLIPDISYKNNIRTLLSDMFKRLWIRMHIQA